MTKLRPINTESCKSHDTDCKKFADQIKTLKSQKDSFKKLSNDVIVYSNGVDDVSYVDCEQINWFKVSSVTFNTDKCTKYLPVALSSGKVAFLRDDGFMQKNFQSDECRSEAKYFSIGNLKISLTGMYTRTVIKIENSIF